LICHDRKYKVISKPKRLAIPFFSQDKSATMIQEISQVGDMESQLRQAYTNILKLLNQYGATMANLVDEVLIITDKDGAITHPSKYRQEIFSEIHVISSTIVQIKRLSFPDLMIETGLVGEI